jgi:hypothetical protein
VAAAQHNSSYPPWLNVVKVDPPAGPSAGAAFVGTSVPLEQDFVVDQSLQRASAKAEQHDALMSASVVPLKTTSFFFKSKNLLSAAQPIPNN